MVSTLPAAETLPWWKNISPRNMIMILILKENDNDGWWYKDCSRVYLQTPRPVHRPHKMAEDTRRNMTPEKEIQMEQLNLIE